MNNSCSNRLISINWSSKFTEYIRILIYTTHNHITILFFKMPFLIPKDHFQSSTEVLHDWSRHSIRHFLECRDYCGFEVSNIFVVVIIHFAFDISPQKIIYCCHVRRSRMPSDVTILWTSSSNTSFWMADFRSTTCSHL